MVKGGVLNNCVCRASGVYIGDRGRGGGVLEQNAYAVLEEGDNE